MLQQCQLDIHQGSEFSQLPFFHLGRRKKNKRKKGLREQPPTEPTSKAIEPFATRQLTVANRRYGSLGDMATCPGHVRFTPNNGHWAVYPCRYLAARL